MQTKTTRPKKQEQFGVRFDKETSEKINAYATRNDFSKAAVIRMAIREFFERQIVVE